MSLKVIVYAMCANLFPPSGSLSRQALCMEIVGEALKAVEPLALVRESMELNGEILKIRSTCFDLSLYQRIHVIGMGKVAPFLFHAVNEILGDRIDGGVIISLSEHAFSDPVVKYVAGSHPVPDELSVNAAEILTGYARDNITGKDLVLSLVSGGASSLVELPNDPFRLEDVVQITQLLLQKGATIQEINSVRKVMSGIKGGKLLEHMNGATVVSVIISDIIGSPPEDIGSGPTVPGVGHGLGCDNGGSMENGAVTILEKYIGLSGLRGELVHYFSAERHRGGSAPKQGDNHYFIIGDNRNALEGAVRAARELKIDTEILSYEDAGDVKEAAARYAHIVSGYLFRIEQFAPPVLLLAGGEHTVQVKGDGKGGRNQEFLLALLIELHEMLHEGRGNFHILSIGTDGIDGPTDAAGAWIDENTWEKAMDLGLDPEAYLGRNDSYTFFRKLDQLIITGPTHTNVMDIRLLLIG